VLSLVIGNIWYVAHRFTVHNIIDWLCYSIRMGTWGNYRSWLSKHIQRNFSSETGNEELKKFIHFRSSQVILILIVAEALILFSFWNENGELFNRHQWGFGIFGLVIFIVGLIQFWIGFNIDVDVVDCDVCEGELHNMTNAADAKNSAAD
jgi:hypothetical protein